MLVKTATCYHTQRGLTLLEVLLASVISSVLILTVSRLIVSEFRVTERLSRQMQLHQQLRTSLALIKRNLLMAGFNAAAPVPVFSEGVRRLPMSVITRKSDMFIRRVQLPGTIFIMLSTSLQSNRSIRPYGYARSSMIIGSHLNKRHLPVNRGHVFRFSIPTGSGSILFRCVINRFNPVPEHR